ncbi:MAG TPA: TylF/MycF/NovP-related O-methyltransferase [Roseiarcus sp.]
MNYSVKSALKRLAANYGVHVRYMPRLVNKGPAYEVVLTGATYSPWNLDKGFNAAYSQIRDATLVDKYRCFELWRLVEQSAKLETGALIEIGVWRGGTAALIATRARDLGLGDKIYACDTFSGIVKAGAEDPHYAGGEHADTSARSVETLFYDTLKLHNIEILTGIFPEETGAKVANLKFRFCHIDVDIYQSAKDVAEWIWERLVPGGIIVYDDYGWDTTPGVARYVDPQLTLKDRIVLHNLNGHAIVIKRW